MYVVYDSAGMITATIIGPGPEYGPEILDRDGKQWLFLEGVAAVDPRCCHVDVASKAIAPHQAMSLSVSKTAIAANGSDVAEVKGIPPGAGVQVFCNGQLHADEIVDDGELEISASSPAAYRITITCWRYLPAEISVTAT